MRKQRPIILLLLGLFCCFVTQAQHREQTASKAHTPLWVIGLGTAGVAGALYGSDQHIRDWTQEHRSSFSNGFAHAVEPFGNGWFVGPSLLTTYWVAHRKENTYLKQSCGKAAQAFVLSGLVTQSLKHITHRHRPNSGDPYNTWDGFSVSTSHKSFPSGHTSTAFSIASVFALRHADKKWVPPVAYGLASLTALSRVHDDKHWASDVVVGAFVGYASARILLHKRKKFRKTVNPAWGRGNGLQVRFSWQFV